MLFLILLSNFLSLTNFLKGIYFFGKYLFCFKEEGLILWRYNLKFIQSLHWSFAGFIIVFCECPDWNKLFSLIGMKKIEEWRKSDNLTFTARLTINPYILGVTKETHLWFAYTT